MRSSDPSSSRIVSVFGWTVRNTGPRFRSITATTTLVALGVSKTMPSIPVRVPATFTS